MTSNYKRGWDTDEHFATFLYCLYKEQAALLKGNIAIPDANKKHHLVIEVWAHNLFDRPVMIEWNKKTPARKTYTHMR